MPQSNNYYLPISMTGLRNPDSYCLPSMAGILSLIDDRTSLSTVLFGAFGGYFVY